MGCLRAKNGALGRSLFFFLRESGCRSLLLCGQSYFVGRAFSSSDVGCCVSCTCIFYVCLHHPELGQSRKTSPHPSALRRDTSRFLLREAEDATVNQPKETRGVLWLRKGARLLLEGGEHRETWLPVHTLPSSRSTAQPSPAGCPTRQPWTEPTVQVCSCSRSHPPAAPPPPA